jgi:hypothetical protein
MKAGTMKYSTVGRKTAELHISNAKRRMFMRSLGRKPIVNSSRVKGTTPYRTKLFEETFGPPEVMQRKNSTLLFWNFRRAAGASGYSLFTEIPKSARVRQTNVHLATRGSAFSFSNWTAYRLGAVENADEPPAFLGSRQFVISPLTD